MNKYGTRTGVAELMCDQLDGDCSKENDHSKGVTDLEMGTILERVTVVSLVTV